MRSVTIIIIITLFNHFENANGRNEIAAHLNQIFISYTVKKRKCDIQNIPASQNQKSQQLTFY